MSNFQLSQVSLHSLLFHITFMVIQISSDNICASLCATHHGEMHTWDIKAYLSTKYHAQEMVWSQLRLLSLNLSSTTSWLVALWPWQLLLHTLVCYSNRGKWPSSWGSRRNTNSDMKTNRCVSLQLFSLRQHTAICWPGCQTAGEGTAHS